MPSTTNPGGPEPAINAPPGVSDNGAIGGVFRYAMENHTHASKARKQIALMGSAATTYLWTYPVAFQPGVIPIVNGIAQVGVGNTDLFNVQILGAPNNTQCTFQITRVSAGLLGLLLGALSINPTPVALTLHLTAFEP